MEKTYKVGTRTSPLALRQVEEVLANLRRLYLVFEAEIVGIETYGDRDKTIPISEIEGTDFFTRDIDEALLKGDIDLAVHSAKDLPDTLSEGLTHSTAPMPRPSGRGQKAPLRVNPEQAPAFRPGSVEGLTVAAITKSIDSYDALVSKSGLRLQELPYGAKIGTSSLRRKTQLKKYRSDFQIVDIRGTIEERLKLLDLGERRKLDAIVIAAAGLVRLGLQDKITERIPLNIVKPHPLQGALAIVARKDDLQLIDLLSAIDLGREISS